MKTSRLHFYDYSEHYSNLLEDVLSGLKQKPKKLHPKLFYDETGSNLFNRICELPEYYISRLETAILHNHAKDIVETIGDDCLFIELGSGNCRKIRYLLPHFSNVIYMPVDIAKDQLLKASTSLLEEFPALDIYTICHDYTHSIIIPEEIQNLRKVAYFSGSSISNFEMTDIKQFLQKIVTLVQPTGGLVIGVDLKKDIDMLNAAYNDKDGVTAAFNRNILQHINNELQANFKIDQFKHHAFYNEIASRIEMHLVSMIEQQVKIGEVTIDFRPFETIHTENSYKFSIDEFQQLAHDAGFRTTKLWLDKDKLYSLHYFGF